MVDLEDLGLTTSTKPKPKVYKNLMKFSQFMVNHILKDSFGMHGEENLEEDYYQMFLCSHRFYTDPILAQIAIALASGNDNPIPAPAYKAYVKNKALGPLMISLFSYPIYGKDDGYTKKEKSLEYSVECFLKQDRILVFPEGRIAHDGKLANGKIGSAEIAWRAYHTIQSDKSLRKKKKGLKIIPMDISYYPIAGIPWKDIDTMTIRFGEALDFEDEVIDRFYSLKNKLKNKEKLKKKLQIKLMNKVMKGIGSLTTVNMDNIASRAAYYFAKKNHSFVSKKYFEKKVKHVSEALNNSDSLYLVDHLKDEAGVEKACKDFLKRYGKKKVITDDGLMLGLNLERILSEPEFKKVRGENCILYNYNLLEHSKKFKKLTEKVLKRA